MMTMYPFVRVHRNWDKRLALHREAERVLEKLNREMEEATDIEDDDAYEARLKEIDETTRARFNEIYNTERALCFPESKNEWFIKFVASFEDGVTAISAKQYNVFARYCNEDDYTWSTGNKYGRVGDRFIVLTRLTVEIARFNPDAATA
jgi:hypothetical protein